VYNTIIPVSNENSGNVIKHFSGVRRIGVDQLVKAVES
jgi:hypothetical protein